MKSTFTFLIIMLSISLMQAQDSTIVSINGSFEDFALGEVSQNSLNWVFNITQGTPPAEAVFTIITDTLDGEKALQVELGTFNGADDWNVEAVNDPVAVEANLEHRASVWLKADSNTRIARLYFGLPEAGNWERYNQTDFSLTTEWAKYEISYVPNTQDQMLGMRLGVALNFEANDQATIYMDNLEVIQLGEIEREFDPIAINKPKFLGNVYSSSQSIRLNEFWNQITPENAGKWGSVEVQRDVMNWSQLDAAYNVAKVNGFPFRFHVLFWGNQQPEWLKALSTEEQEEEILEWMTAVAERYPDMDYLEVVNEPLHDPPIDDPNDPNSGGYIETLGGTGETGWDWVVNAFDLARQVFPVSVKFMINDYNILGNSSNVQEYLEIINLLKEQNLIDAIGVQGHHFSTKYSSIQTIKSNMDALAETGLPLMVTEFDINGSTTNNSEAAQLQEYQRIFPSIWEHESVVGVTLWGWRPGLWVEDAVLISNSWEQRSALTWLREYVETTDFSTSFEPESSQPSSFELSQNYPNPFNPTTNIEFKVSSSAHVSLTVFDITGKQISVILNETKAPGTYYANFNATGLSSGVYFYKLSMNGEHQIKKMTLVK